MNKFSTHSLFLNNRVIVYLAFLIILQCIIAYGALLVFDSLPRSITGLPDDTTEIIDSQKGTVTLILREFERQKDVPPEEIVAQLKPYFGYPISLIETTQSVKRKNNSFRIRVDQDNNIMYVPLENGQTLKLGPISMHDILESDIFSFSLFIFFWSLFSAVICFILTYFAFRTFWKDLFKVRDVAEQIGQGNLKARINNIKSWLLKPLSDALNTMAMRIEYSMNSNQIISHAMAHELRTPLARIHFELSMYKEAHSESQKEELYKNIYEDLNEVESLIKASLSYFKMQQSKIKLNLTCISLKKWIDKVCTSLLPLKPSNFELQWHSQDKIALIDTKLADTIVRNLLLNAFKYANSKVVLNVTKKQDMVIITIDDDGPGIPLAYREEIFMPFARLNTKKTRHKEGYGLGLAYVKLISEFHYGNTFVVTSALGGARFVATLKVG